MTFDILVPLGRTVRLVMADGMLAMRMTTHTPPGLGYEVQTWDANLGYEPTTITIEFERS